MSRFTALVLSLAACGSGRFYGSTSTVGEVQSCYDDALLALDACGEDCVDQQSWCFSVGWADCTDQAEDCLDDCDDDYDLATTFCD